MADQVIGDLTEMVRGEHSIGELLEGVLVHQFDRVE